MSADGGLQQRFYEMLMESQWWSADQLRNYQRSQLSQLLRHAKQNVPFYEQRLDPALRRNGEIDWDRWREIPIVTRRDMVDHRAAMQARDLPPGHGPTAVFRTSGSTGLPIEVTVTGIGTIAGNGLRWRVQRWQGLDWGKTLCNRFGGADHGHEWPEGQPLGFWGPPWDERSKRGGSWLIGRELPSEILFEIFREHRASYLLTSPNRAHVNAVDALRLGIDLPIEVILFQGNVVRPADREICTRVFSAKTVEFYSSKEGGQIAHQCPEGMLHVNSEACLVEVLDDSGLPVASGETGRVVVTPIFETAQPLIRYEQGDLATVGAPCACGRHSLTLSSVRGRNIAIFRHPDGRALARPMPEETTLLLGARYWQLAQVGPVSFELRFVPGEGERAPKEEQIRELFERDFFSDAQLRLVPMSHLPTSAGGKVIEYVNEWQP